MCASSIASRALVCAVVASLLAACESASPSARQYELRGQILAIRPATREIVIKHGDIQGFMPGMTMPFKVKDASLLEGKTAGDLVTAQLMVAPNEAWLSAIEKTGSAPLAEVVAPSPVVPLQPGDAAPAAVLTDENGKLISIPQLRGRAVVVSFIYTRCPLPQFCPMIDRRFAEVQRSLVAEPALAGRTRLLSVSFDPDHDQPPVLKAHAAKLGADPAIWTFATAERATVDALAAAFGVSVMREADRTITHNLRTAVIGPDGRIVSVYSSTDWTAAQIVDDVRRALPAS